MTALLLCRPCVLHVWFLTIGNSYIPVDKSCTQTPSPCVSIRWPVGPGQLPHDRLGQTQQLHPLHDRCARQGLVRPQEQDLCGAAQSHEDWGKLVLCLDFNQDPPSFCTDHTFLFSKEFSEIAAIDPFPRCLLGLQKTHVNRLEICDFLKISFLI